ncbi:di-trans,poly-cis-decaprenylcistransferase, partial [Candidatus Woesearchaeota archaeon]|nr:di-trans,poly-cis-decaprenylcistransferase [Candidatus Woesearchaeota archaeon]
MDSELKIPRHIAIILDGNRRYAKSKGLDPWKGHEAGAEKIRDLLQWCKEFGVKELTLYTFSTENFNRSKIEVDFLMNLLKKEFHRLKDSKEIHENKVRINVVGNSKLFAPDVQEIFREIMEKTKGYDGHVLNFALGYGSREEITQAARKIAEKAVNGDIRVQDIDEGLVAQNLYLKNDPDLLIRSGGEKRISN